MTVNRDIEDSESAAGLESDRLRHVAHSLNSGGGVSTPLC